MASLSGPVTVFGGTGFLGRRVVRHLLARQRAVRVASRHQQRSRELFGSDSPIIEHVRADVDDQRSVAAALAGAGAAVNAVSLYVERNDRTFHSVHVEAAARIARQAREAGLARLLHVSGIGSDPRSTSKYIRSRGEGEVAVQREFPAVTLIRPAVMFGLDDAFLAPLAKLLRRLPVFAMFGRGETRLQPAHVEDVAEAMARAVERPEPEPIYEFGGPDVLTYEALLKRIRTSIGSRTLLAPMPFPLWLALGSVAERLPHPPITRNQVELMREDNVAWNGPGFAALEIEPTGIGPVLSEIAKG
jgi:NADH dehydrogenase